MAAKKPAKRQTVAEAKAQKKSLKPMKEGGPPPWSREAKDKRRG